MLGVLAGTIGGAAALLGVATWLTKKFVELQLAKVLELSRRANEQALEVIRQEHAKGLEAVRRANAESLDVATQRNRREFDVAAEVFGLMVKAHGLTLTAVNPSPPDIDFRKVSRTLLEDLMRQLDCIENDKQLLRAAAPEDRAQIFKGIVQIVATRDAERALMDFGQQFAMKRVFIRREIATELQGVLADLRRGVQLSRFAPPGHETRLPEADRLREATWDKIETIEGLLQRRFRFIEPE